MASNSAQITGTPPRTGAEDRTPKAAESRAARHALSRRATTRRTSRGALKRWLYMMALFIYLLALAMTLFEIDAFQTLVAQMTGATSELGARAGTSRQREILQAVRSSDGSVGSARGDGSEDRNTAIYTRVAAALDPLRVAINLLQEIGTEGGLRFEVRSDEVFKRQQKENFAELASRIDLAVIDLRKQIQALRACGDVKDEECQRQNEVLVDLDQLQQGIAELDALSRPEVTDNDLEERIEKRKKLEDTVEREAKQLRAELLKLVNKAQLVDTAISSLQQFAEALEVFEAGTGAPAGTETQSSEKSLKEIADGFAAELPALDLQLLGNKEVIEESVVLSVALAAVPDVDASETPLKPEDDRALKDSITKSAKNLLTGTGKLIDLLSQVRLREQIIDRLSDVRLDDSEEETVKKLMSKLDEDLAARDKLNGVEESGGEHREALETSVRQTARQLAIVLPGFNPGVMTELRVAKLAKDLSDKLDALQDADESRLLDLVRDSYPADNVAGTATAPAAVGESSSELVKITAIIGPNVRNNPEVAEVRRILSAYGVKTGNTEKYKVELFLSDPEKRNAMDETLMRQVMSFQEDAQVVPRGKAVKNLGRATRAKLNAFVDECNKDPACIKPGVARTSAAPAVPPESAVPAASPASPATEPAAQSGGVQIDQEIQRLRIALRGLKNFVANQEGVDLRNIGILTGELAKIQVAARRLSNLDPKPDTEMRKQAVEAPKRYQQAMAALTAAIDAMRATLNAETPNIAIANAIGDDPLAHKKAETILREFQALDRYQAVLTPLAFLKFPNEPPCRLLETEAKGKRASADTQAEKSTNQDKQTQPKTGDSHCVQRFFVTIWNRIASIGFRAKDMATMTRQALDMMVVFVMGAIGSLIYLIRYLLSQILLSDEHSTPVWRPWSWYVFRPLFGIVVAFAIYLLYKTGQVALGGANTNVLSSDVNLPILSIVSLFAGLLSWQALEMVESKGRRWLSAQRRESLWATGLRQALRLRGKTVNDCASQVGVTPNQVERWIGGQDKVTPEMQDRICTWLEREWAEIFGTTNPRDVDEGALDWATGLKEALKNNRDGIDVPRLAQMVGQDVTTVQAWVELRQQVDQPMQFLIAEKLKVPRETLFQAEPPDAEYWAVGLRNALYKGQCRYKNADELAKAIGSTRERVRRYMELKDPVSKPVQALIAGAMEIDQVKLFDPNQPLVSGYKWAAKLRDCMAKAKISNVAELADKIDTEATWVRAWMEQEVCGEEGPPYCGQVPPFTQPIFAEALGCDEATLFRAERAAADFRWVVMPRFADLVKGRGGVSELASRLDLDESRVQRWMTGQEPVAPATQLALLSDLQLPVEELDTLFTHRPPPDPSKPQGTLWATGLREAVRAHPGYRTLGRLASELGIPAQGLYDKVELLEPVPTDLRDRILVALGPATTGGESAFSNRAPDWSDFRWAPGLRDLLGERAMSAEDLASALDVDLARVLEWTAMDERPAATHWAQDKVKRGQLSRDSQDAVVRALGGVVDRNQLFATERSEAGSLWAVKPLFALAVNQYDRGLAGFAGDVDAAPEQVERWIAQTEPVPASAQSRILKVLGLGEEDSAQLFLPEKRELEDVG